MLRPKWLVYNTLFNHGGGRLPKRIVWVNPENLCKDCDEEMKGGTKHLIAIGEGYRCHPCWLKRSAAERDKWVDQWRKPRNDGPRYVDKDLPLRSIDGHSDAGNLTNWLYRFWVGTKFESGKFSMCRCCRKTIYDEKERENHNDAYSPSCYKRLTDAYRKMLADKFCVVCHAFTNRQEYGVPLCKDYCVSQWKFSQDSKWTLLEGALRMTGGWIEPEAEEARTQAAQAWREDNETRFDPMA